MKENKDALKAIQEFADKSPTRSDKLEQAKQLTQELYGKDGAEAEHRGRGGAVALTASSKTARIVTVALCCVVVLLVVFLLLFYFLNDKKDEVLYFDSEAVYSEKISELEQFKSDNKLDFLYYEDGLNSQYEIWRLKDNEQLVYITQTTMYITQSGFDTLFLGICFNNDSYQAFDDFVNLTETIEIGEVSVYYRLETVNRNNIYAKFSAGDVIYYLSVTTVSGAEVLEQYVNLLLA